MKEKFIKIDNENYIKEAEVIEGGFLDQGFKKYVVRIEIDRPLNSKLRTQARHPLSAPVV